MCAVKNWDDQTARNNLANSMEGEANLRVQHIDPFGINPLTGYLYSTADLLLAYDRIFLPEAGGQLARSLFKQARQRAEGEDILAWHSRLRTLFQRSDPHVDTETSRDLIEQFVQGLVNRDVRDRTYNDFPQTYTQALHYATQRHAALIVLQGQGHGHRRVGDPDIFAMSANPSGEAGEGGDIHAVWGRCYLCNDTGHFRRDCPKRSQQKDKKGSYKSSGKPQQDKSKKKGKQGKGSKAFKRLDRRISQMSEALEKLGVEVDAADDDKSSKSGN